MRLLIYIQLVWLLLINCSCTQAKQENRLNHYKYADTMKHIYFANYDFGGSFDLILNGIKIRRNRRDGVISGADYLNPFISKKGIQYVTLIVKPLNPRNKITPQQAKDYFIDIIYTENGEPAPVNKVNRCSFPEIDHPVDSLVHTWTFDAVVSYKLEGLENSQDLTKEDPAKLLNEILAYYKNVHEIINLGNSAEYLRLYKKSREREMVSMYYDVAKQNEYLHSFVQSVNHSKGEMQPLTGYKLFIHPNGKLAGLITDDGSTPLYARDKEGNLKSYGLELHRVKKSDKLEVY
ncbi:hypothetical protein HDE68_002995 [Pedobacter cryoconitis]|uniref:Lipoprotein n=2 Tax=Pedobacter cryoconitis TaxID=188932 RepID=A0A7W8ZNK7_9SPHI|nr:hypothetical protein [Pedobacter cryoconitis]